MGKVIQNIGELLYNSKEEIIYRPPNKWKPVNINVKDRKIVRQYQKSKYFDPVIIDFVNKTVKIPNNHSMTIGLVNHAINNNNRGKNKAIMYIGDYGIDCAISEDEISLVNFGDDTTSIPSVLSNSFVLDYNMFLIYHEDKLLFVL